jgi:integrase
MAPRESYQAGTVERVSRAKVPDVWVFRYRVYDLEGNPQRRSETFSNVIDCPTQAHAERKIADRRKEINEQRIVATFNDLADKYESEDLPANPHTRKTYLSNLQHLRKRWGKERLDAIAANMMAVQLWLNNLKDGAGKDYSIQTRQHVRNLMHKIFEDGMLWGILPLQRNPLELVTVKEGVRKKRRKLILTWEQIDTLLRDPELPAHVKGMVMVAVCTGMRVSEVLGLRWEDINFKAGAISILRRVDGAHVGQTKSEESEQEDYPMHPLLASALRAWEKAEEPIEGWVFGSAITGRPFHASTLLADHLKPAAERAGIHGLGWHTFRHTFRALLADMEQPLEVQQALMRHSDISMTVEYGKFSAKRADKLRAGITKMVALPASAVSGL